MLRFRGFLTALNPSKARSSPSGGTEASKGDSAESRKLPGLQPSLDSMQNGLSGAANIAGSRGAAKGVLSSSSQNRDDLQSGPLEFLASKCRHPTSGRPLRQLIAKRANQGAAARRFPATSWHRLLRRAMQTLQDLMQDASGKQSDKSNASTSNALQSASQQYLQAKTDSASHGVPGAPESRGEADPPDAGAATERRRWDGYQYYVRSQATLGSWKRDASVATAAGESRQTFLGEHDCGTRATGVKWLYGSPRDRPGECGGRHCTGSAAGHGAAGGRHGEWRRARHSANAVPPICAGLFQAGQKLSCAITLEI